MLQPPGASRRPTTAHGRGRKVQESPDDAVRQLQKLPPNKKCADCTSKLPSCVNLSVGTFICITCAGMHRELNLGRVKGVGHSSFTQEEADRIKTTDNDRINAVYMAKYNSVSERLKRPVDNTDPQLLRAWITRKYRDKAWYSENGGSGGPVAAPSQAQQQSYGQPTMAQIPPKSSTKRQQQPKAAPEVDLLGGFTSPAPPTSSASGGDSGWDAFGGSQQTQQQQAQQQPPHQQTQQQQQQPQFKAHFASFGAPPTAAPPAPTPAADPFPANFGSTQTAAQFVASPPQQQQQQPAFQASFPPVPGPGPMGQMQPMPQQQQQYQADFPPAAAPTPQPLPQQQQQFQPTFPAPAAAPQQSLQQQMQQHFQPQQPPHQQLTPPHQQGFLPTPTVPVPQLQRPQQQQVSFQPGFPPSPGSQPVPQQQPLPQQHFANFNQAEQQQQQQQQQAPQQQQQAPQPPQQQQQQFGPPGGAANGFADFSIQQQQVPQQQQGGFASFGQPQQMQPTPAPLQQQQQPSFPQSGATAQLPQQVPGFPQSGSAMMQPPQQLSTSPDMVNMPAPAPPPSATAPAPPQSMTQPTQQALSAADAISKMTIETPEAKKTATKPEKGTSKYKEGQIVTYTSASYKGQAKIVKVHFDDDLDPFYTIAVDGKEKQTDDSHLAEHKPLRESIDKILGVLSDDQLQQVHQFIAQLRDSSLATSMPSSVPDLTAPTSGNPAQQGSDNIINQGSGGNVQMAPAAPPPAAAPPPPLPSMASVPVGGALPMVGPSGVEQGPVPNGIPPVSMNDTGPSSVANGMPPNGGTMNGSSGVTMNGSSGATMNGSSGVVATSQQSSGSAFDGIPSPPGESKPPAPPGAPPLPPLTGLQMNGSQPSTMQFQQPAQAGQLQQQQLSSLQNPVQLQQPQPQMQGQAMGAAQPQPGQMQFQQQQPQQPQMNFQSQQGMQPGQAQFQPQQQPIPAAPQEAPLSPKGNPFDFY